PALVMTLARTAPPAPAPPVEDALVGLRSRVPAGAVPELDQLVSDARATFGVRDDNGGLTGAWPMGLLRRAMLAAGRRLTEGAALVRPEHALEVTVDELMDLLLERPGLSAVEVSERAERRRERSALVPPLRLGPDLDIPLEALPAPMRAMSRAQLVLRDTFTAPLDGRADLDGDGIGTAPYQGRAVVAVDPADALDRLEPGDVLVAFGTTPAFNMALSIAGAVVVEEGGLLSHAAVIARELGLTALIGASGAMAGIPDGALVEVDPVAGRVRVLAAR
ncbi:MAG: PEP-utilizing enzyme, partial [Acidimicrobiales bacterium]